MYSHIRTATGAAYTLALIDQRALIAPVAAWPNQVVVPPEWLEPFPVGTLIDVVQYGEGQTSFLAAPGVALYSAHDRLGLPARYSGAALIKTGPDEWVVVGRLIEAVEQVYPDSIIRAGRQATWDLQRGGTGPRSPYVGRWSGVIDAYLEPFFILGNDQALYTKTDWFEAAETTLCNYSFKGAPPIHIDGPEGAFVLQDCDTSNGVIFPCDINGNIHPLNTGLIVKTVHCLYDGGSWFMGAGDFTSERCRYRNQPNIIGSVGFDNPGGAQVTLIENLVTGGGCAPSWDQHVELSQFVKLAPPTGYCAFALHGNMIDVSQDGQPKVAFWNSAWTAVESIGAYVRTTFTCNVAIGLTAVNANPINPNVIGCVWAYGAGSILSAGGNVMEPGMYGYGHNQTSGDLTRPVQSSPNWDFATGRELIAADFTLTEA